MDIDELRYNISRECLEKLLACQHEDRGLDFKETHDASEGWAELVKDIMAFANTIGGHVVFGVRENKATKSFEPIGLPDGVTVNEVQLRQSAERLLYTVPEFQVAHHSLEDGKRFAILYILKSNTVISAKLDGYKPSPEPSKPKKVFAAGSIYQRVGTENQPVQNFGEFVGKVVTEQMLAASGNPETLTMRSETESRAEESYSLKDALVDAYGHLEYQYASSEKLAGAKTGFHDIDSETLGLQPGDLILLAARPGTGKTSVVINFARNAARLAGTHVLFFSAQHHASELGLRFLAVETGISLDALRRGRLVDTDWQRLGVGLAKLAEEPVLFATPPLLTLEYVHRCLRGMAQSYHPELVVVDQLQLMTASTQRSQGFSDDNAALEACHALRRFARIFSVPILVTTSCSRSAELRADRRPMLRDLNGMDEVADVILTLYRDEDHRRGSGALQTGDGLSEDLEVILAKNPYGGRLAVKLGFSNGRLMERNDAQSLITP